MIEFRLQEDLQSLSIQYHVFEIILKILFIFNLLYKYEICKNICKEMPQYKSEFLWYFWENLSWGLKTSRTKDHTCEQSPSRFLSAFLI